MRNIVLLTFCLILFFISCQNKEPTIINNSKDTISKKISLDINGDTAFVAMQHSNIRFVIHYYKNKPQGYFIQNDDPDDSLKPHYQRDQKGYFISLDPTTNQLSSMGFRYLRNQEGGTVIMNEKGNIESVIDWQQYENNGYSYEVSEPNKSKIRVFSIKDGEKVDSFMFAK